MKQIRRKFDKMLFEGQGRQLLLLSAIILSVLCSLLWIGRIEGQMKWQTIVALFMDPGIFANAEGHDFFRIVTALLGVFLFSALLISVLTNIFENISTSYKKGESVYTFRNHILIIGAAHPLKSMLCAIRDSRDKRNILVMTASDVESIRSQMEIQLADPSFFNRITYLRRERNTRKYLKEACAEKASLIYVIGEDKEQAHDALNIRCLSLLKELCGDKGAVIPCYLIMEMHSSLKLFNYMKSDKSNRLNIEIINESDYSIEQLLVETTFMPALTEDDEARRVHLVIAGNSVVSRSFASVAAHICHYPNFKGGETRTKITLIGYDKSDRDLLIASYRNLFNLCHYRYISKDGVEEILPQKKYGDFLDIEWEFIEDPLMSPFVISLLGKWVVEPKEVLVMAMCYNNDETNTFMALHLPKIVYDSNVNIAVHQNDYSEIIDWANSTNMFGKLFLFGNALSEKDLPFINRSTKGKRVNRVYDLEYGNPPAKDEDEAWCKLPIAHKQSSIASANSIPIKLRSFRIESTNDSIGKLSEKDLEKLSEVEHRRWMVAQLLMGYSAAPTSERKDRTHFKELKNNQFIHLDIAPFDELPNEKEKDLLIVKNIPYIMTGQSETR